MNENPYKKPERPEASRCIIVRVGAVSEKQKEVSVEIDNVIKKSADSFYRTDLKSLHMITIITILQKLGAKVTTRASTYHIYYNGVRRRITAGQKKNVQAIAEALNALGISKKAFFELYTP